MVYGANSCAKVGATSQACAVPLSSSYSSGLNMNRSPWSIRVTYRQVRPAHRGRHGKLREKHVGGAVASSSCKDEAGMLCLGLRLCSCLPLMAAEQSASTGNVWASQTFPGPDAADADAADLDMQHFAPDDHCAGSAEAILPSRARRELQSRDNTCMVHRTLGFLPLGHISSCSLTAV